MTDTSGIMVMRYEGFVSQSAGAKDTWGVNSFQIEGEKGYIYIKDGSSRFCRTDPFPRRGHKLWIKCGSAPWHRSIRGENRLQFKQQGGNLCILKDKGKG